MVSGKSSVTSFQSLAIWPGVATGSTGSDSFLRFCNFQSLAIWPGVATALYTFEMVHSRGAFFVRCGRRGWLVRGASHRRCERSHLGIDITMALVSFYCNIFWYSFGFRPNLLPRGGRVSVGVRGSNCRLQGAFGTDVTIGLLGGPLSGGGGCPIGPRWMGVY